MRDPTGEVLKAAEALAASIEANAIVAILERPEDASCLPRASRVPVVVAARKPAVVEAAKQALGPESPVIWLPDVPVPRMDRVKLVIAGGLLTGVLKRRGPIVVVAGTIGFGLDFTLVMEPADEYEMMAVAEVARLAEEVEPMVFPCVLDIAMELARTGREGKPVGALFVIGDHERVLELSQPLVFNPFHGYPECERNVLSPELRETLREFSTIDGAVVISAGGVVMAAGRYLQAVPRDLKGVNAPGLGARHAAAAGITGATRATAVALSESAGIVRVYRGGRAILELSARGR